MINSRHITRTFPHPQTRVGYSIYKKKTQKKKDHYLMHDAAGINN